MLDDVLEAITLGRKLVKTVGKLRRDVESVRAGRPDKSAVPRMSGSWMNRIGDVESLAKEHDDRLQRSSKA